MQARSYAADMKGCIDVNIEITVLSANIEKDDMHSFSVHSPLTTAAGHPLASAMPVDYGSCPVGEPVRHKVVP
jgi:hypothetical protein